MINFKQLRIFYHVAKDLSFTEAGRNLFITQPAVTNQVKTFEDSLNLKLFYKSRNKIFLTNEGKALFEYAKKVFEYEKEIELAISDIKALKHGILRLGISSTMAPTFMHCLVKTFEKQYPGIRLQTNEGSSLEIINSIVDYRNDVAVTAKVKDHPDVRFAHFTRETLCLILHPNHKLARHKLLHFDQLSSEPVIMREVGSGTRKVVDELFQKNNYTPYILVETGNTEFIKQLVQRGEGISFLAKSAVLNELQDGNLITVPLEGDETFIDVYIVYVKYHPLPPPARAFFQLLRGLPIPNIIPSFRNLLLFTDLG